MGKVTPEAFDVWEIQDAASVVRCQVSTISCYHIQSGSHQMRLTRDITFWSQKIARDFEAQRLTKSKALRLLSKENHNLVEQDRMVSRYGVDFIADAFAVLGRHHTYHSAYAFCSAAYAMLNSKNASKRLNAAYSTPPCSHSPNARQFKLFYYIAKEQFYLKKPYLHARQQRIEARNQHIINSFEPILIPVPDEPKKQLTTKERLDKQRKAQIKESEEIRVYVQAKRAEQKATLKPEPSWVDNAIGGVKQLANDYIAGQRAILAEHLVEKNVFQVTDSSTGELLNADDIAHRYRQQANTFDIDDLEQSGADAAKSVPYYGTVLLAAELATSKGKKLVTDPKALLQEVTNAVKDTRSIPEALGHLGGQHAQKKLGINSDADFVNRYHGPDYMGRDKNNRLVEIEYKGNNKESTRLSSNKQKFKQGSDEKNKLRARTMLKKKPKVNVPAQRQGGAYTQPELKLWEKIRKQKGAKQHMASFTNTESGQVKLYRQNKLGAIGENLLDEKIPDFDIKKSLIEKHFKNINK